MLGIEIEDNVKLINATNPNIETIRKSIIPTQLCQVKYNTSYATDFGVFEIGRVVEGVKDGLCNERKKLAITLFAKTEDMEKTYFKLRDIIAVLADDIKHETLSFETIEKTSSYEHPKNLNKIMLCGEEIGKIGIVNPTVSKKIDKKANIVFAEIDVEKFAAVENLSIKYKEPSKFPGIDIDITFISDKFAPIADAVKNANCELIKGVDVADIYIDDAGKAITVRIEFAHPERTLTKEEVMDVIDGITNALEAKGIALKK